MNRRKKKFVRADLQTKIVFIAFFVACLALLVNFQMSLATLWAVSSQPVASVENTLDQIRHELVMKFLITVGLTIPLSICVGILYSFKFCGPIFKFKKYCDDFVTGNWESRCSLRDGDDLWDVCDSINAAVGTLRERVRDSHQTLQQTREVLDQVRYTVDEAGKARIQELREKIDLEEQIWKEHFEEPNSDAVLVPEAASQAGPRTDVSVV